MNSVSASFNSVVFPGGMKRLKIEYCEGAERAVGCGLADGRGRGKARAASLCSWLKGHLSEGSSEGFLGPKMPCFPQSII